MRKDGFSVENLTEEKLCRLGMSPIIVLYLVASEFISPERITERHIVRAMEYGLEWKTPFSEGIFELLRSHLHEFYAEFPRDFDASFQDRLKTELLSVREILDQLSGPAEMIEDFRTALKNLATFVAAGGAFRRKIEDAAMRDRAAWIGKVFSQPQKWP